LVGAIVGKVSPEAKLGMVRAVSEARSKGMTVRKACEVLDLPRLTFYHWLRGRAPDQLTVVDLSPVMIERRASLQRITEDERASIVAAAQDEAKVDLHHRKLAHTLGREERVYVSESTVFRVLKEEGLVAPREVRHRPAAQRPALVVTAPRQVWCWDFSYVRIGLVFWYLLAIIDMFSRKIVGWDLVPQATAEQAKRVWVDALGAEGLLNAEPFGGRAEPLSVGPDGGAGGLGLKAMSDNGTQMKAKTMREFFRELGIDQVFSRPHTPEDNAYIESWFATAKCECIYREEYSDPVAAWSSIGELVRYYNEERLHQGIGFVTPVERHEGRDVALLEARKLGLVEACRNRPLVNRLAEIRERHPAKHNVEKSNDRKGSGSEADWCEFPLECVRLY
jgi:putative transposase